jgi:hypothetical protein
MGDKSPKSAAKARKQKADKKNRNAVQQMPADVKAKAKSE